MSTKQEFLLEFRTFISSWKSAVGVGAFSIPYTLYVGSPIIGIGLFIFVGCISVYNVNVIMKMHDIILASIKAGIKQSSKLSINEETKEIDPLLGKVSNDNVFISYQQISQIFLGNIGYYLCFWSVFIALWGALVAYVSFLKINLNKFVFQMYDIKLPSDIIPVLLMPVLIVLLLVFTDMKRMSFVNFFSLLTFIIVVFIMLVDSIINYEKYFSLSNIKNVFMTTPTWESFMTCFGLSSFLMEGYIGCCVPIYESLFTPKLNYSVIQNHYNNIESPIKQYKKISVFTMIVYTSTYILFGVLCILRWNEPSASILLNFNEKNIFDVIIVYFCCLEVLTTYPMVNYAIYISMEDTQCFKKILW